MTPELLEKGLTPLNPDSHRLGILLDLLIRGRESEAPGYLKSFGVDRAAYDELLPKAKHLLRSRQAGEFRLKAVDEPVKLVSFHLAESLVRDIPPRDVLMTVSSGEPLFTSQSINQLFAWRGVGKTNFMLSLSLAMAAGRDFLNWRTVRSARVLFIEGEMPNRQLQDRQRELAAHVGCSAEEIEFYLVGVDDQLRGIPSILTAPGKSAIENKIAEIEPEVLVLDSIATLATVVTNEQEVFENLNSWFRRLRTVHKVCLFLTQHAGKGGMQRGSSASEDPLDISLKMEHPKDYEPADLLRAVLTFDKTRGRSGAGFAVMEVRLTGTGWSYDIESGSLMEQVKDCIANGKRSPTGISKELGCSREHVQRCMKKIKEAELEGQNESEKSTDR